MPRAVPSSPTVLVVLALGVTAACAPSDAPVSASGTHARLVRLPADRWSPPPGAERCDGSRGHDRLVYADEVDRRLLPYVGAHASLRVTVRPSFSPESMLTLDGDTLRVARFTRMLWTAIWEPAQATARVAEIIDGDTVWTERAPTRDDVLAASVPVVAARTVLPPREAVALAEHVARAIADGGGEIGIDGVSLRLRDARGRCVERWHGDPASSPAALERMTRTLLDSLLGPPPRP